jgi:hypothetical protein
VTGDGIGVTLVSPGGDVNTLTVRAIGSPR